MQRQGHLVLDQFESVTQSDPNCVLKPGQEMPELTAKEYKQALKSLCNATTLVFNDAPEASEVFTPALVEVLFDRQVMRSRSGDNELLYALEDVELFDVCEQLEVVYQRMIAPAAPTATSESIRAPEHVKRESVHANIVGELSKIFEALLSKIICLHGARFRELKEKIEQSLSVYETYHIIYNAKNGNLETKAESERAQKPEKQSQSWFGSFFASEPSHETKSKSKLATKPNQTLFGGLFRRVVYDNLDDVYAECMKVFEKYKEHEEVKTVLDMFQDTENEVSLLSSRGLNLTN